MDLVYPKAMSQASFLSAPEPGSAGENSAARVSVLAAVPIGQPYDYAVPAGIALAVGDIVRIPFGRREVTGVVWPRNADSAPMGKAVKLKSVLHRYDVPPLRQQQIDFVEWIARYTLSDIGSVLKLMLSPAEVLEDGRESILYSTGTVTADTRLSAPRQRVLAAVQGGASLTATALAAAAGCTPAVIQSMAQAGQLARHVTQAPAPAAGINPDHQHVAFSPAQQEAASVLESRVAARAFAPVLLDGVTGSGKTEVYFAAVAEALRQGRQALVLLPEISLSAQFMRRIEQRFGMTPALWHSEVTPAQKRAVWQGVARGDTQIVLGARSALFLPFADLGCIVVDEEHDASYKQEDGVLYNARDMSVLRAQMAGCPIVLVSATPSLESMTNAQAGKYTYLHLPTRHAGATLPAMQIVDLRHDKPSRNKFLSPLLVTALRDNLDGGEQSLLFLNRRGYAPLTLCRTCGHRFQCPSCSAWLVEHRRHKSLQCHHCGYTQKLPPACPSCNDSENLVACGPGVERIYEEVVEYFPDARVQILASDMVGTMAQLNAVVAQVEAREIDIIIGTQMIAKGHHFPALTLVGVVDADLGLAGGDLRAGERTFQVLHQVAGRAGRAQAAGRVLLQTVMPDQAVIRALAAHDRDAFLRVEGAERQRAQMPPYGRLAAVIVSGPDENQLLLACRAMAQQAQRVDDIRLLGPAAAPLAFLRGHHRQRFLLKATGHAARGLVIQHYLQDWLSRIKLPRSIDIKVDIDPQSFF